MGLPSDDFITWSRNGIEYLYPAQIMSEIFACAASELQGMSISNDSVTLNGIQERKKELAQEVVRRVDAKTVFPQELEEKLLAKVAIAIA